VAYRLRNEKEPDKTLTITRDTWYGILELAEEHGWNPFGTSFSEGWSDGDVALAGYFLGKPLNGDGYGHKNGNGHNGRLVILEDALNLADALEQAFLRYEHTRVPASFFYFEPLDGAIDSRPSIGALLGVLDFCSEGAFWVEN
jgi:hypothetical protein